MTQLYGRCFITQSPDPRISERAGRHPGQSRAGPGGRADPPQAPAGRVPGAEQKRRAQAALCWLAHRHAARLESVLLQIDDGVDFFFFSIWHHAYEQSLQ